MVTSLELQKTPFDFQIASNLLAIYGSPLYIYREDILKQTITHITKSIPYSQTKFHFASVTNGNVSLLQIFNSCGWGLHANTPGDIYLGLKAGFDRRKIIYSGSNLNAAEMSDVLHGEIGALNLDSVVQLDLCCQIYQANKSQIKPPKLGLRLNLPSLTGESRIGVRPEEFKTALNLVEKAGLKLTGLHFYRGTGTNATEAFTKVIETLLSICQQLPDWEYLDFGGGFGYPYARDRVAFDWEKFGKELTDHLNKLEKKIDLIIEPGRAAIAGCGTLLTKVVSVKWQDEKQIVGVDTTVANLSVPSVHGGYRKIVSFKDNTIKNLYLTDVCGNTTYSRDYLGKNCQLPKLNIGDIIAILDVGAYGYVMSSHFLHRPLPPEVLIENDRHRIIRQREDYSILLQGQVF